MIGKTAAFDELRDNETEVSLTPHVEDRHDPRMLQSSNPAGLGHEGIGRFQSARFRDFDGNDPLKFQIKAPPDLSEAPFGD